MFICFDSHFPAVWHVEALSLKSVVRPSQQQKNLLSLHTTVTCALPVSVAAFGQHSSRRFPEIFQGTERVNFQELENTFFHMKQTQKIARNCLLQSACETVAQGHPPHERNH